MTTRVTTFAYDWRNRHAETDGEEDFFEKHYYDNLGRVVKTERYDTNVSGNLVARSETLFDDRRRVYRTVQYGVDPNTGTVGNALTDNTWFDGVGNAVKSLSAGSKLFTKSVFDGVGRQTKQFVGFDLDETAYAEAFSVSDDTILEQTETDFDATNNVIQTTHRQRYHNATGTGELTTPSGSQPKARVTYAANYSDAIGRSLAEADFGTNGGAPFTRPATIPGRSETVLVTSTEFNPRGEAFKTIDPAGKEDRTEFDDAGRRLTFIENYVDGLVNAAAPDEDRTTRWTYAPDGGIATLTAVNPETGNQTTAYVYGTTLADSGVARSDLKRAEVYPDSVNATDRIIFAYNRFGETVQMTDQNGTVHIYDHDKLGRLTQDRVVALGAGIDGTVRRIETTYDTRGSRIQVTSFDNPTVGSGLVLNEVRSEYNGFGQLIREYQAHDGAVNPANTPKVEYAYTDGSDNTIRPTGLTYPNGRMLSYAYGTAGSTDDAASRPATIRDGSTPLVNYEYLGIGLPVEVNYLEPDLRHTLVGTAGGTDAETGDIYLGLDRFGRVKDVQWRDYGSGGDAVRIKHGYDRAGNQLWREDVVAASQGKNFDEFYAHDGLHRLANMGRGRLHAGRTTLATTTFAQDWSLNATGNWSGFREDGNGNGTWDLDQNRMSNPGNEITGIAETAGLSWVNPAYDHAGNMTTLPDPGNPTQAFAVTYDAWNRVVKLEGSFETVNEFTYDGRGFRIADNVRKGGALYSAHECYYSEDWELLEVTSNPFGEQYVWGIRYIDDLVCRDRDTNGDGTLDERLYALQDANWNVVALANATGDIQERYAYSAYGVPVFLTPAFGSRANSGHDWNILYAGYRFDAGTGLYCVRLRYFHGGLGAWLTRDPAHYRDAANLYLYVGASPLFYVDPAGAFVLLAAAGVAGISWGAVAVAGLGTAAVGGAIYVGSKRRPLPKLAPAPPLPQPQLQPPSEPGGKPNKGPDPKPKPDKVPPFYVPPKDDDCPKNCANSPEFSGWRSCGDFAYDSLSDAKGELTKLDWRKGSQDRTGTDPNNPDDPCGAGSGKHYAFHYRESARGPYDKYVSITCCNCCEDDPVTGPRAATGCNLKWRHYNE